MRPQQPRPASPPGPLRQVFIVGSMVNFAAFSFASSSILVPLEAVQLVVNVVFNKVVNNAPVSCRMVTGVALAVTGTTLAVIFGPNDERCFTISEMEGFWSQVARRQSNGCLVRSWPTRSATRSALQSKTPIRHASPAYLVDLLRRHRHHRALLLRRQPPVPTCANVGQAIAAVAVRAARHFRALFGARRRRADDCAF